MVGSTWLEERWEEQQGGDHRHQNSKGEKVVDGGFVGRHDGTCLGVELGKHGLFPHLEDGLVFV